MPLSCDAIEPNNAVQPHIPYADSTLRLFLPCLELLCTNMLSEQANIPATGSNKDETWTLITSRMHHVIIQLFNNYGRPELPNLTP